MNERNQEISDDDDRVNSHTQGDADGTEVQKGKPDINCMSEDRVFWGLANADTISISNSR